MPQVAAAGLIDILQDVYLTINPFACTRQVSTNAGMSVGMWVRLKMDNPANGSLIEDMNGGYMPSSVGQSGDYSVLRHASRISAMGTGWIK